MELKKDNVYPWLVVIGIFFLRFGGLGAIISESAIYFVPIRQELGIMPGELSFWITCYAIGMAISMLYVGKLYPKVDTRILLSGSFLVAILACGAMGFYYEVWQFCISGFIIGLSGGFIFMVPGPIILSNWFAERRGLAIGLSAIGSGTAGVVLPIIGTWLIQLYGWRMTEFLIAGIAIVLVLPWTLFVIRYKPEEKGMLPFGWSEEYEKQQTEEDVKEAKGIDAKVALVSIAFWCLFLAGGLASCFGGFRQHFTTMADEWGYTAMFAATMLSVSSIATFVQPIIGWLNDRIGPKRVTLGLSVTVIIALLGFMLLHDNEVIVIIAAFLFMLQIPVVGVQIPLLVREIFGAKDYPQIFSYIQIGIGLIGAFSAPVVGFFYDTTGSYAGAYWYGIGLAAAVFILTIIAYATRPKFED